MKYVDESVLMSSVCENMYDHINVYLSVVAEEQKRLSLIRFIKIVSSTDVISPPTLARAVVTTNTVAMLAKTENVHV